MTPTPETTAANRPVDAGGRGGPLLIDTSRPHPGRRYNFWLGGKDHFAADRTSGDRIANLFPTIRTAARENRRFLRRAVTYLAAEVGIRQFLDIGCGIPAAPDVHDLAQAIDPTCRVAYVDNDPMVIAHARALMTSHPAGAVACVQADLRDPDSILGDPAVTATIDLTRPVAVLLVAVLHFLDDTDHPRRSMTALVDALPAGSQLVISHATLDPLPADLRQQLADLTATDAGNGTLRPRTSDEIAALLHGLDLSAPVLVPTVQWRPDLAPQPQASVEDTATYAAVARLL